MNPGMEPMALGSPTHSPASPGLNPNFLPSFLMGDTQPNTPNPSMSPGRSRTPNLRISNFGTPSDSRNLRQKLFNQSVNESSYNQSPYNQSPFNNIPSERNGPPKQGLFDSFETSKTAAPILNSTAQHSMEHSNVTPGDSFSRIGCDTLNYSQSAMHNLNDSVNNRPTYFTGQNLRSEKLDTVWVTVFGFPPSATSLVLAQLANCGCINEKKFPTQGNWVHLKYSLPHEAAKALSLNGKLIASNIMVGVVSYQNKQENKENIESGGIKTPNRGRSLRQSFVSPQAASPVLPQNVPQKSTGLVTKAMEYVFGW